MTTTSPWDALQPVTFKDFLLAHQTVFEIVAREGGQHSPERTFAILSRLFPSRRDRRATAIVLRMRALALLHDHPMMRRWIEAGTTSGDVSLSKSVFEAAAQHPFDHGDGPCRFDAESFFERVLLLSRIGGYC